jgi:hypothetical protein
MRHVPVGGGRLEFHNRAATGSTIVGGNLDVRNDGGTTTVSGNPVGGDLDCKGNGCATPIATR